MFRNRKHASACSQGPHSGEASSKNSAQMPPHSSKHRYNYKKPKATKGVQMKTSHTPERCLPAPPAAARLE